MTNEDQEILQNIQLSILPLSNTLSTFFVHFITTLQHNLKNTLYVKVIVQIHACVRPSIYSPVCTDTQIYLSNTDRYRHKCTHPASLMC